MKPKLRILGRSEYSGEVVWWWVGTIPRGAVFLAPVSEMPMEYALLSYLGHFQRRKAEFLEFLKNAR